MERASIRILARRFEKSKTTIMNTIHDICSQLPDSVKVALCLKPKWSGILVIDGKSIKAYDPSRAHMVKRLSKRERKRLHRFIWIVGVDTSGGDIPNNSIADEETKIDIMMYFKDLKAMNYPLVAVVSDGVPWYGQAARKVFGDHIVIQRCTRHFLKRCRDEMSKNESKKQELRTTMLIFIIKRIIEAGTLDEARQWLRRLKLNKRALVRTKIQKWIVKRFKEEAVYLTAHLHYPELNIPHTNNDAENMIGQAEKRLSTISRFNHWTNARDYLNAWTLWRRFTPYTDCRGERKHRNGKTPLQLSGVDTDEIDWLDL